MKGKKPQFDLKESKMYKTLKDANDLASEVGNPRTSFMTVSVCKHAEVAVEPPLEVWKVIL